MFIDANIFITAYLGRDKKAELCQGFLERVERGEQHAITSVLVLDEVLNSIALNTRSSEKAISAVGRLLVLSNLKICDVNASQLSSSLTFFKSGLRPRDALHVATMRENGVSTILSFDKDFDSIKSISRREP